MPRRTASCVGQPPGGPRHPTNNTFFRSGELKSFLEKGVSSMPSATGGTQVSGLCFTHDIAAPVGSRVTTVVRQAPDGSYTGTAVDLTAASWYRSAESHFMATGGDGYPNVYARGTTQNLVDQVLADHVTANSPVSPTIQERIVCTTSGATACRSRSRSLARVCRRLRAHLGVHAQAG